MAPEMITRPSTAPIPDRLGMSNNIAAINSPIPDPILPIGSKPRVSKRRQHKFKKCRMKLFWDIFVTFLKNKKRNTILQRLNF